MTTALAVKPQTISISRADASLPILVAFGKTELAIRSGTVIHIGDVAHTFEDVTYVSLIDPKPGADYGVGLDRNGDPVAGRLDEISLIGHGVFAGFHFAPGGNAEARTGGDTAPAINPFSLWDLDFRPSCPDPRGMAMVEVHGKRVWVDIYMLGRDHKEQGTSRYGSKIADGNSLDRLNFADAKSIVAEHGKRLMTYDEFRVAAVGVTEKSASPRDPDKTGLDPARTSRFGLMQATGNLWVWGTDGDQDDERPSIFGGSWVNGSSAGSRYANLACHWPENSNEGIGARAACDHLSPA